MSADPTADLTIEAAGTTEPQLQWFAEALAFELRRGDVVALRGELGAGKTTFARAAIRALAQDAEHEVPSPTFTLVQTYDFAPVGVAHLDLYRLSAAEELDELGFDHLLAEGAVLIEWPERAEERLPAERLEIGLAEPEPGAPDSETTRTLTIRGTGGWKARLERLIAMCEVIRLAGLDKPGMRLTRMTGDASNRRYGRLTGPDGAGALLMDWPRAPDGPPVHDGKPYSQVARLAEDVRPFLAIGQALRSAGLAAPEIFGADLVNGFIVLEDLGPLEFAEALRRGVSQRDLWRAAVDVLGVLRSVPAGQPLAIGNGETFTLARLDRTILETESELVLDWLWPAIHGSPVPETARHGYRRAWAPLFEQILAEPSGWMLRDYHSPNLILIEGRSGYESVGLIDFQDALQGPPAYDLVSLLQDARLDVPARLEAALLTYYCQRVAAGEPDFEAQRFRRIYAMLGAQRASKILGIFARLAKRDKKPGYLKHMPRIWGYLERNLAHPDLMDLARWYEDAFPRKVRLRALSI